MPAINSDVGLSFEHRVSAERGDKRAMSKPVMNLIFCCLLINICGRGTAQSSVEPRPPKQTFIYKSVANTAIKADVYRLTGGDPRPVIVWIHPGGLIMGSREMLPADECE